ncbi:MAG: PQQ-dependent sugar dehydrogenase [Chloroflexi bacterium]|nr:PQQ-dependent sugar dehydrogenase [Chloroflexota bacterium]
MRALAIGAAVVLAACGSGAPVVLPSPSRTAAPAATAAIVPAATATPTLSPTPRPVPKPPIVTDTVVQTGLVVPWDIAFAPDGRMFVTERPGNVLIFESAAPGARRVGHFSIPSMRAVEESGLMGIALDPDFARNGFLYVCASRQDEGEWRNQVLRLKASGNDLALDGFVVRRGMLAGQVHDGCAVRIGPGGKLWVTMGESGRAPLAQDVTSLNGKVLRLELDGSVPRDNPVLPGRSGPSAIWSYGHRNPQGLAIQPGTGAMYEVEHGEDTHDEINVLVPGGNYGWPIAEGPDPQHRFVDPRWSSGNVTIAPSGATFVVGAQWGTWTGSLFTSQLKQSDLRRFIADAEGTGTGVKPAEILLSRKYGRLRAAVFGPDGALYLSTSNRDGRGAVTGSDDRIIRIEARQP